MSSMTDVERDEESQKDGEAGSGCSTSELGVSALSTESDFTLGASELGIVSGEIMRVDEPKFKFSMSDTKVTRLQIAL